MQQNTDWTRFKPLQTRFNTQEVTQIKDYLPIVGNSIPHKQIATFDGGDTLTFTQLSGTATGGYDNIKSYHGKACYKVSLAASSSAQIELDFNTPIDLTSLGKKQNNYAQINRTGLYGNQQDQLFFILNTLLIGSGGGLNVKINLYTNNNSANMNNSFIPQSSGTTSDTNRWNKMQWGLNSTYFTITTGFDFSNITKIIIIITTPAGGDVIYFQDLILSLPKVNSDLIGATTNPVITNAYYPAITESNSIFVSQLFGNDTNTGVTKQIGATAGPVKTTEQAFVNALGGALPYIVILDSETYKPVALDGSYVGISQGLTNNITIIADYLETPVISAKPGVFNNIRIGARTNFRTAFYENTSASGTIRTVGTGGTYSTIGAANTAATAGDCIQILDSNVYDELLTCNKNITIEAAPGQTPTWQYSSGITTLAVGTYTINVYGIIFKGNGVNAGKRITVATSGKMNLQDCTFTNTGANSSGHADAIYITPTGTQTQTINNCLFSNNGEYFTAINHASGASGTVKITNCLGYMGTTYNNIFISSSYSNTNALNIYAVGNQSLSSYTTKISNARFYNGGADAASTTTNFYGLLNDTNEAINIPVNGGFVLNAMFLNNYFHDAYLASYVQYVPLINTSPIFVNGTLTLENNYFYNITGSAIVEMNVGAAYNVNNNIFNNCNSVCIYISEFSGATDGPTFSSNVFYNCYIGLLSYGGGHPQNNIFANCATGISASGEIHIHDYNNIAWNSPYNSAIIDFDIYITDQNPNFIDPANGNFGWYFNSPIETLPEGLTASIQNFALSSPVIKNAGSQLSILFMDIEGFFNTAMVSGDSAVYIQYCNIENSLIGIYSNTSFVHCCNSYFVGNAMAARYNNVNITAISNFKNNIISGQAPTIEALSMVGAGLHILSGLDCEYNTIINNTYGVELSFTGYFNTNNFMSQYLTIKNNIIMNNDIWDYVGTIQTDYCVIQSRYYDQLPITDINYIWTSGPHDNNENTNLDPDYLYPANIYMGYRLTSAAFMAGSIANTNIGARSRLDIIAETIWDDFTFRNLSDVYGNKSDIKPINLEENFYVDGSYEAYSDKDIEKIILSWDSPESGHTRLLQIEKQALQYMYMTYWFVSISRDGGMTWNYYKMEKGNMMSFATQWSKFLEQPYGSVSISLVPMPESFDITEYTINTIGAI